MYKIFKHRKLLCIVFHVWVKRILNCNDTTFFLFLIFNAIFPLWLCHQTYATKLRFTEVRLLLVTFFITKVLAAAHRLELLCHHSKIRSCCVTQFGKKVSFSG